MSYLRWLANTDDDTAFIRALTTPRKGVGQTTLERLGQFASAQGGSLWQALPTFLLSQSLNAPQKKALTQFYEFIQRLLTQVHFQGTQAAELLDTLLRAIDYEGYLFNQYDERPALSRWQNVLDLLDWLKRKLVADQLNIIEPVQHVSLVTILDRSEKDEEPEAV